MSPRDDAPAPDDGPPPPPSRHARDGVLHALLTGDVVDLRARLAADPRLASWPLDPPPGRMPLPAMGALALLAWGPAAGLPLGGRPGLLAQAVVDALQVGGGDPGAVDPGAQASPLSLAARHGASEVARVLWRAGVPIDQAPLGEAPLDDAAWAGQRGLVDRLVAWGAAVRGPVRAAAAGDPGHPDLTGLDGPARDDALTVALAHDRLAVMAALWRDGDGARSLGPLGGALAVATWFGRPRMVRWLADAGVDPTAVDPALGMTPQGLARMRLAEVGPEGGHDEVLAVLARKG